MQYIVWLIIGITLAFGVPLFCVGSILRLCEYSWKKPKGGLGSKNYLLAGFLLCLPGLIMLIIILMQ